MTVSMRWLPNAHPFFCQKIGVEVNVVADDDTVAHDGAQFGAHREHAGRVGEHVVGNAGKLGDEFGYIAVRVDEGGVFLNNVVFLQGDGGHFDEGIAGGV